MVPYPSLVQEAEAVPVRSSNKIPNVFVNDVSTGVVSNLLETKVFVLTNCSVSLLGSILEVDFLRNLDKAASWQLITSDLIFGYFKYNAAAKSPFWNPDLSQNFLELLRDAGKILILTEGHSTDIPLLSGKDKIVTVTCGLNSPKAIGFKLETQDKDGLAVADESLEIGSRSKVGSSTVVAGVVVSSRRLEELTLVEELIGRPEFVRIAQILASDPNLQLELNMECPDRLLDLWYLKSLWTCFKVKTHVTKEYADFVNETCPDFADSISSDNSNGQCRFHYDCCELTSNEDCVPGKEWALEYEVNLLTIGPNNPAFRGTFQIKFFHDNL